MSVISFHDVFTTDVKKLTDDEVADRRSNLFNQIRNYDKYDKTNPGITGVIESSC